jgi:hypothetical protein
MLAREKWQIRTIEVLERVFEERQRQMAMYGDNSDLEDGVGPDSRWLSPVSSEGARSVEGLFRKDYEEFQSLAGKPTWMHLVREELAEAFELDGDDPEFVDEILQVAALCVSWAEKKLGPVRMRLVESASSR